MLKPLQISYGYRKKYYNVWMGMKLPAASGWGIQKSIIKFKNICDLKISIVRLPQLVCKCQI